MDSTTLKISVSGNEFFLSCRRREKFCVGSAEDCKLCIDGEGIAPEHCEIERLSSTEFSVRSIDKAKTRVNGLGAIEVHVESPFQLGIGEVELSVTLVEDSEAEGFEEVDSDTIGTDGVATFEVSYSKKKSKSKSRDKKARPAAKGKKAESISPRAKKTASRVTGTLPCAIPALRFAGRLGQVPALAGGLSATSLSSGGQSMFEAIALPSPGERISKRKTPRAPETTREASPRWFATAGILLALVFAGGFGWLTFRKLTLPYDTTLLHQKAEEGDRAAIATLAFSQIRGDRGIEMDRPEGVIELRKEATAGNPFALLALGKLRHDDFVHDYEATDSSRLWKEAYENGLTELLEETADPRWSALSAIAGMAIGNSGGKSGLEALRSAGKKGDLDALDWLARNAPVEERKDWWKRAVEAAQRQVQDNSVYARRVLGMMHLDNLSEDADPRFGKEQIEIAAGQDDPVAQFRWARILEPDVDGREEAFRLMESAANSSYLPARAELARYLLKGIGTDSDPERAREIAEEAADFGSSLAQRVLAEIYIHGAGVSPNLQRAEEYVRPGARNGDSDSIALLGEILRLQGRVEEAEPLLRQSAEEGNGVAAMHLGNWLSTQQEEVHQKEAIEWLEKAVQLGVVGSIDALIAVIDSPDREIRNPKRAAELLQMLVEGGNQEAAVRLSSYYLEGRGVEKKPGKAVLLLKEATEQGVSEAWFPLGQLFESGAGEVLSKSEPAALDAYQNALKLGDDRIYERFPVLKLSGQMLDRLVASWNGTDYQDTTGLLAGTPEVYFHLAKPDAAEVAALEAGWRQLWPSRSVTTTSKPEISLEGLDQILISVPVSIQLVRTGASAFGKAQLTVSISGESAGEWSVTRVEESKLSWEFAPNASLFQEGKSSRDLLPATSAESAAYSLANLPRKQIEQVTVLPFTDKFGRHHPLIPTSIREGVITFSRIDREGDLILPTVFFDPDTLKRIEQMSDSQYSDVFKKEFDLVRRTPDKGDPKTAQLIARAQAGDNHAKALVGGKYYDGMEGFPYDRIEALKWFVESARAKDPLGRCWIAVMTSTGEISASEPANSLFRKVMPDLAPSIAVEKVKAEHWRATAECFAGGEEISLGSWQPKQLLERAISGGDLRAQLLWGNHLLSQGQIDGVRYLRYASDGGCASAALSLAKYYLGKGNDPRLAVRLLEQASRKNVGEAQLLYGLCYREAKGVEKDLNLAAFWIQLALETAKVQAQKEVEIGATRAMQDMRNGEGADATRRAGNFFDKTIH